MVRTLRLELPDGSARAVKVTTNELNTTQHVEDWEGRVHGTGRVVPVAVKVTQPSPVRRGVLLRNLGMPRMRQAFSRGGDDGGGLWAPVPGSEVLR